MKRFLWLTLAFSSVCTVASIHSPNVAADSPDRHDRPNIVVLFADDMGFSDVGCYGSEIKTPNIDRLAAGGLRFSHFYNTGRCCPSRASILTGLYPHQADIGHMAGDLQVDGYRDRLSFNAVTLAEVLGQAGYHTIMTGKWHLGWRDEGSPTARGFQHFYGTRGYIDSYYTIVPRTEVYLNNEIVLPVGEHPVNDLHPDQEWYTTDVFTDYALHFIDQVRKQDREPFFLYLAYNAPHFPLHAKPEDIGQYRGTYRDGWQHFRKRRYEQLVELGILDDSWPLSPLDVPEWDTLTDQQRDDMDFKMSLFAAIVDRLDQNIGRVIDHLQAIGELDNTLIVFLSDNGGTKETGLFGIKGQQHTVNNYPSWAKVGGWTSSYGQGWANLSNTPFRRYKRENHEGGISAPFILHWPAVIKDAGALRHQPAHLIDLMPTFVELSGAQYPEQFNGQPTQPMQGTSLTPTFDSDQIRPRTLYWEHEGNRAIRDGDMKLVGRRNEPWELYDIAQDRTELNDLAADRPDTFQRLRRKWDAWADDVGVLSVTEFDQAVQEMRQRNRKPKSAAPAPSTEGKTSTATKTKSQPDDSDPSETTNAGDNAANANTPYVFNRAPLATKPYSELPLGTIQPQGWLRDELTRMANGMTGHLDQWYPEVCGPRNAWLGGDGDTWERGPYWIDGLYPLAKLLDDPALQAKAQRWIEWTLANQRPDGQIGPRELKDADREVPPPPGAQTIKPDDWWPRMVMLKILQQHYLATGDQRVIQCLTDYFRFQLRELPDRPLHDPSNPRSGSWWAAQRGGDNLMVVLWLYNVTGDEFLLDLADLIHQQTVPVTDWFNRKDNKVILRADQGDALHCVNLAQMMKTPVIRWQQDQDPNHLDAVATALADIRTFHGQPHGLYGGDEGMHGDAPDRGSELCSAVEMMYSLEKMFEITGDPAHADHLERVAFNALPTQCTDDHRARQYFQQTNQVQVTFGERDFFNDNGDRVVYGLLQGYPCCTCNLHQGWPKFTQHLWMASNDGGLAAVSYAPCRVTARTGDGSEVTLVTETGYPFKENTRITVKTDQPVSFPVHLRIPGWADGSEIRVDGQQEKSVAAGTMHVIKRTWNDGDTIELRFPMPVRSSQWFARSRAIERGPLVYALDIAPEWKEVVLPRPEGVPDSAMHRGYLEARPKDAWNYALPGPVANQPQGKFKVEVDETIPANPWTRESAPVRLKTRGIPLADWQLNRNSASPPPLSSAMPSDDARQQEITLIPYGATTLRIAAFPWIRWEDLDATQNYPPDQLRFASASSSHCHPADTVQAVRMPHEPISSADTTIRRWTSWPQVGQDQWVEIRLQRPTRIDAVNVYFYDDGRGVALPRRWHVEALTPTGWQGVRTESDQPAPIQADQFCTVHPVDTQATSLRIVMQPRSPQKALGILSITVDGKAVEPSDREHGDADQERPNFVFFLTDDISPDDLSVYGNPVIQTPHLDQIASQGLVFDNAYLTISSCSPSRASIITGRYPHNTGAPELHSALPADQVTFIQKLQQSGYHTVISGKNHMAPPRQLGFDVSSDSKPSGCEKWVQHLRDRPKDRPFFCWFASHDAHRPFTPDEHAPTYQPGQIQVPPMMYDGPGTRQELADYAHEVSRTDHYAGELMAELSRQGIADNTYFVYCSDNGRPFPRCKTYLYDSGIKTPLIISGPGVATGRTDTLVSSIDFSATFLELAKVAAPVSIQGVSFADTLADPQAEPARNVAFAERNWHVYQNHQRAVRTGDWLYIWNAWPERYSIAGESSAYRFQAAKELWEAAERGELSDAQALLTRVPQPAEMLFNVKDDPHQLNNLAGQPSHRDVLVRLGGLLDRWKSETGDSVPDNPTPDRQSLHEGVERRTERGEFPGQANKATSINASGPVMVRPIDRTANLPQPAGSAP
ncbi:sulfatase-like hydrolase/transferase [Roseiconus nitratireducens]|nr:sulfatase-like hydrolase/transferase [Roseiconus nitratireducens]